MTIHAHHAGDNVTLCGYRLTDHMDGVPIESRGPLGVVLNRDVDCRQCRWIMGGGSGQHPDTEVQRAFLPLDEIEVNGLILPAEILEGGSIVHDIDKATLTVTFCNVREVATRYKHQRT